MKKTFLFTMATCVGISLLTSSCSDDELTNNSIEQASNKSLTPEQRLIFNEKLDSTLFKLYSKNNDVASIMSLKIPQASYNEEGVLKTSNIGKNQMLSAVNSVLKDMNIAAVPTVVGPLDSNVATPQVYQRNKKILISSENGYPPTGVYFADVLQYSGFKFAPANAVSGFVDEVSNPNLSPWGWGYKTSDGFSEANRGFTFSQSRQGSQLYMTAESYSIHVRSNIIGQGMGGYNRPTNFTGQQVSMIFQFYYITL